MNFSRSLVASASFAALLATGSAIAADQTIPLTLAAINVGGAAPYGWVDLTDTGDSIQVHVYLRDAPGVNASDIGFVNTGEGHTTFAFTVGGGAYSLTGLTSGFERSTAPFRNSPYGDFGDGVDLIASGGGNAYYGALDFSINRTGISIEDFIANGGGFVFSADVFGNGFTGSIASNTPVTPVPEPGTYALMLAGLGVVGYIARRRKQNA